MFSVSPWKDGTTLRTHSAKIYPQFHALISHTISLQWHQVSGYLLVSLTSPRAPQKWGVQSARVPTTWSTGELTSKKQQWSTNSKWQHTSLWWCGAPWPICPSYWPFFGSVPTSLRFPENELNELKILVLEPSPENSNKHRVEVTPVTFWAEAWRAFPWFRHLSFSLCSKMHPGRIASWYELILRRLRQNLKFTL